MSSSTDHIRVIVLGDSGVGKTSFCRMLCARDLPPEEARKATGVKRARRLACRVLICEYRLDRRRQFSCTLPLSPPPSPSHLRDKVMNCSPVVELWDVGGGSMITDSRRVTHGRFQKPTPNTPFKNQHQIHPRTRAAAFPH
jgi:GTPase SAR1 family protein